MSNKFKYGDTGFKYLIGYKDDNIIRPLCIVLPPNEWCHEIFLQWWKKYAIYD